jgi:hypothetical protein
MSNINYFCEKQIIMVYGQNIALKFQKEETVKSGIISTLKPKNTMKAEIIDYGSMAKKEFPELSKGMFVIVPQQPFNFVDDICYVNIHQILCFCD